MKRIVMMAMILGLAGTLRAQFQGNSLFTDHRAFREGDVITILVMEYATASSQAQTSTSKDNDHGFLATGGNGAQAYSPMMGIKGNLSNNFRGNARVTRQGNLKTKITATVTEVQTGGNLVVQGSRVVEVNGEQELTTVTGVVRPQDISGNNTIYSYQLADAQISYKGKGVVNTGQRPGFLARVLNWIF